MTDVTLLTNFIAAFSLVNMLWNGVQIFQYLRLKFGPPEAKVTFDSKSLLMLEELYASMRNNQSQQGNELHRVVSEILHKEDSDGRKLIYSGAHYGTEILKELHEIKEICRGRLEDLSCHNPSRTQENFSEAQVKKKKKEK